MHTLSYWRWNGTLGPTSVKLGGRVFYRRPDVENWLAQVDGWTQGHQQKIAHDMEAKVSTVSWYQRAVEAASRVEPEHTAPWKLATTYALLSIAESMLPRNAPPPPAQGSDSELLTVDEVAEMTRLSAGTLRYWRSQARTDSPKSFRLGRRVMYRRTDVETWIDKARG